LALEENHVSVRLFRSPELARTASQAGARKLIELALQKDLGWLQKDLRSLHALNPLYAPIGAGDELQETAFEHLLRHAFAKQPGLILTRAAFEAAVTLTRERLAGLVPKLSDHLKAILQLRQQIALRLGSSGSSGPGRARTLTDLSQLGHAAAPARTHPLAGELDALLPARFLEQIPFERLVDLQRYLKALLTRIERAKLNPPKDQERARQLAPFVDAVNRFKATPPKTDAGADLVEEFRWLVEEFKVSVFAQELGTAVPVSTKRLEEQLRKLQGLIA